MQDFDGCKRLIGKVAMITGAASGIGQASARRFIAEGARVAIVDINGDGARAMADELGQDSIAITCDAGDVAAVEAAVAETVKAFGGLNILFNNAALMSPDIIRLDTTPTEIDFAIWDKTFAVNVRGYLAGCKYAIPHMIAAGGGSIIMTSSGSAVTGDIGNVAYGSSKAAVNNLVRYVATIYGKQGVRCNAISPGLIRTEGGKKNVHGPMVEIMERNTLAPRLGQPEDIAAMAAFLAADEAEFITGQIIAVDGGMMAHAPYISDILSAAIGWDT
ncbi:MAG: SDR family oxidoreductase [Sphingorhabdus sp.]